MNDAAQVGKRNPPESKAHAAAACNSDTAPPTSVTGVQNRATMDIDSDLFDSHVLTDDVDMVDVESDDVSDSSAVADQDYRSGRP